MSSPLTDIAIARATSLEPIERVAARINVPPEALYRYGPFKAKLSHAHLSTLPHTSSGKLILVTAISPTPAGEGKSTTTIGLGDALTALGQKTIICLREPSLGPCFGMKGGATGGGYSQVVPMDEINLHFTGDFHAITAAHNLLAAMIDNHLYWGNDLQIDPTKISWRRAMDMNDRALRQIVVALGNNGLVREDGFDITVASEVMAIFCLSRSLVELEERLGRIIVGRTKVGNPVTARALKASSAMAALLRDAFQPNIVQTLEHTPAFVHGGPFANIAHGCNTLIATETGLKLADFVVTEAGFGADLGAEKFFDIKCRQGHLRPAVAVIVATVRALKMHGGVDKTALSEENVDAVLKGLANLKRHIENVHKFGVPVTVAINHFSSDTEAETDAIIQSCAEKHVTAQVCRHWAQGGRGAEGLAREVLKLADGPTKSFKPLYADSLTLHDKIQTIAMEIYGARSINLSALARKKLQQFESEGFGRLPVCMAKTQYSFSSDPLQRGAPHDFVLEVRDVRLSAGAGFVVALCGDIMTMPGLPRQPAAEKIHIDDLGMIEGLF